MTKHVQTCLVSRRFWFKTSTQKDPEPCPPTDTLNLQLHMEQFPLGGIKNWWSDPFTLGRREGNHSKVDRKGWDTVSPENPGVMTPIWECTQNLELLSEETNSYTLHWTPQLSWLAPERWVPQAFGFFFFYIVRTVFTAFFFFSFIFISWRLITLQYCSGFCHTLTWISHGFTCTPHPNPPSHLPLHPIPLGLPSAPGLSTCLMYPTWAGDLFHPR